MVGATAGARTEGTDRHKLPINWISSVAVSARPGRLPSGAGTYAADDCCAVSATGHGEFFIRAVVAHEIASLVRHAGLDVVAAAERVVRAQLVQMGGEGGVIAIGRDGRIAMPYNSRGMLRGSIDPNGRLFTAIL